MNPSNRLAMFLALAALWLGASPAPSQGRTLYWEELAVRARLDALGTLHVEERQTMVFTGDWNGGERKFNLRMGERLKLQGVSRIDPETGAAKPLAPGDLSQVDQYDWADSSTLRWRSRQPSDPPFENTAITYVLDYTVSGLLEEAGSSYRFRHDFAFPDREGVIERFVLDLELDPVWRPEEAVPAHLEKTGLAPGESVIVGAELGVAPGAKPAVAVHRAAPVPLRYLLFAVALGAMTTLYFSLRQREAALGRYEPLPPVPDWDEVWLREHLFSFMPEEIGALWDRRVGPPEVAAVLARLVGEGKLTSEVRPQGMLFFKKDVLHLKLEVDRSALDGYERQLIDKLFFGGRTETDTESVRQHYRRSGLNPSGLIEPGIQKALETRPELRKKTRLGGWKRTAYLALGAAVLFGVGAVTYLERTLAPALIALFTSVWLSIFGLIAAFRWRSRVERLDAASLTFLLPGLIFYLVCAALACIEGFMDPDVWTSAGLALLPLVLWSSLLNNARTRETAETIRNRKLLAAIRRQLARELESPEPRLKDEWLPYLLAFGLGTHMDRWFRSFGGSRSSTGGFSASGSGSPFGSSGGSSGWTGGGGAFGGGGSTASWAAAATGLAAGVSSSSSSSGGGGGGGGSSGGGGGGGW